MAASRIGVWGLNMVPKYGQGKGEWLLEAHAWRRRVCVCEELYPSSFHESFEELHSKRVTLTHFHSQIPLFILKG